MYILYLNKGFPKLQKCLRSLSQYSAQDEDDKTSASARPKKVPESWKIEHHTNCQSFHANNQWKPNKSVPLIISLSDYYFNLIIISHPF